MSNDKAEGAHRRSEKVDINWRLAMSRLAIFVILPLITAFNLAALTINLSIPSRAAVGRMSYEELVRDQDFTRAVKSIAEACAVNVDLGRLKCQ